MGSTDAAGSERPVEATAQKRDEARARWGGRRRWPLLAWVSWLAAAGAIGQMVLAWGVRDDLRDASGGALVPLYVAFMAQVFLFHAGIAMAPVVAFALLTRRRALAAVAATVLVFAAGEECAVWLRPAKTVEAATSAEAAPGGGAGSAAAGFTVMSVNMMYGRVDAEALARELARFDPDIILVQEWTPRAASRVGAHLREGWPHVVEAASDGAFGQAIFSRRPLAGPALMHPPGGPTEVPQMTASLDMGRGRVLRITNVHTFPPASLTRFGKQRAIIRGLAAWIERGQGPHLLAGDFNATSRTALLGALHRAGLREAHVQAGSGRGATWPRIGPLRLVPGIRLDHLWHGPDLVCVGAWVGDETGSDHLPVAARFRWKEGARAPNGDRAR